MISVVIGVIVHATNKKEVLEKGTHNLEKLIKTESFSGYRTFQQENTDNWKDDLADLPPVLLASSPKGKDFIEGCWQLTVVGTQC